MDDDIQDALPQRSRSRGLTLVLLWTAIGLSAVSLVEPATNGKHPAEGVVSMRAAPSEADLKSSLAIETSLPWTAVLPPRIWVGAAILLAFSAFFSASEVAFFSLHPVRLRSMRQSGNVLNQLAAHLMDHPGNLLTSILMGNCIVNVLLGIVLGIRVERLFQEILLPPHIANPVLSYVLAVALCTAILVFFGEITPKLVVVRNREWFARFSAVPMYVVDRLLMPVRGAVIHLVAFLFRVTRFSEVRPAPFMTDEEFKSILSESKASGVIEEEERQMIQGILEFSDVMLREILVPRPDMIVLKDTSSVGQALAVVREHDYARIPVYKEDLDDIIGILYAKDLLPAVDRGELEHPVTPLLRKAHFVPETMTVAEFMKTAQRLRTHLAIVVDEYGGTEGLVTLQDALREVVGDIGEDDEFEAPLYTRIKEDVFQVDGSLPLDELSELTGVAVQDEEHTTVAGFVMAHSDRVPQVGDEIEAGGLRCRVEEVKGKRLSRLRIQVPAARSITGEKGVVP